MRLTLSKIRDYFKNNFEFDGKITIGKIDKNEQKAICFYKSDRTIPYNPTIGYNKSTNIKPITILLRYTKNQDTAENKALDIYEFFEGKTFFIEKKRTFIIMDFEEPINLGTDEDGVYEYSIGLNLYVER